MPGSITYRPDIDGLRAIAVLLVIFYHFGWVRYGYLGVDVFFVISGFLITSILFKDLQGKNLSLIHFYNRRIRRIIPLVLLTSAFVMAGGIILMLPSDLDNLVQSVVATNLFANNILEFATRFDYWNVVNEFKPLMHSWSLGIEEQFYLLYPFLFVISARTSRKIFLPLLIFLCFISVGLYLSPFPDNSKFYLIPFRFFELGIGGIAAIYFQQKLWTNPFAFLFLSALTLCMIFRIPFMEKEVQLIVVVLLTASLTISTTKNDRLTRFILENSLIVFVGKISFSLYMWHQVLLAFMRYAFVPEPETHHLILVFVLTLILSILSYFFIEKACRNPDRWPIQKLLILLSLGFFIITGSALGIYFNGGVIRDVPELEIKRVDARRNMHLHYNTRHIGLYSSFEDSSRFKIIVIGNSFARDWINVLLESDFREGIQVSYYQNFSDNSDFIDQLESAEFIFLTELSKGISDSFSSRINNFDSKTWFVGTKSFGISNGIFYSRRGSEQYCAQRNQLRGNILEQNERNKTLWKNKYIDLIGLNIDSQLKVPVFTPDCKFISQDCKHFTRAGAEYYAHLLAPKFEEIFRKP